MKNNAHRRANSTNPESHAYTSTTTMAKESFIVADIAATEHYFIAREGNGDSIMVGTANRDHPIKGSITNNAHIYCSTSDGTTACLRFERAVCSTKLPYHLLSLTGLESLSLYIYSEIPVILGQQDVKKDA